MLTTATITPDSSELTSSTGEKENTHERIKRRIQKTRRHQKTILGSSPVDRPNNRVLKRIGRQVYHDVTGNDQSSLRFSPGLEDGINYYYMRAMEKLLIEMQRSIYRFATNARKIRGKKSGISPVLGSGHVLNTACTFIPPVIANAMNILFATVMKTKQEGQYRLDNMVPLPTVDHSFRSILRGCQLSNEAKIALSCYATAILRRLFTCGIWLMERKFRKIDESILQKLVGVGTKTLSPRHLQYAVAMDKPQHNPEEDGFGLAAMFSMGSLTQSNGLYYMPAERCHSPMMLKRFHPDFVKEEEDVVLKKTKHN